MKDFSLISLKAMKMQFKYRSTALINNQLKTKHKITDNLKQKRTSNQVSKMAMRVDTTKSQLQD